MNCTCCELYPILSPDYVQVKTRARPVAHHSKARLVPIPPPTEDTHTLAGNEDIEVTVTHTQLHQRCAHTAVGAIHHYNRQITTYKRGKLVFVELRLRIKNSHHFTGHITAIPHTVTRVLSISINFDVLHSQTIAALYWSYYEGSLLKGC